MTRDDRFLTHESWYSNSNYWLENVKSDGGLGLEVGGGTGLEGERRLVATAARRRKQAAGGRRL